MPLNERCLSSKFHGYDVKSASACAKSLLPRSSKQLPQGRLLALLSVVWRPLACVLTLLDVLDKDFLYCNKPTDLL